MCVNVRARVGARVCVRLWVRARACALEAARVYVYACACACALAGAGWRTCGCACVCVYMDVLGFCLGWKGQLICCVTRL